MNKKNQQEQLADLLLHPVPKKKIGVVRLKMVKESTLYGMKRIAKAEDAAELVSPLFHMADREMLLVMSLSTNMEPLALEIAAVGGLNVCYIDQRDIFKHSMLNNAAYLMCFHNHPSGNPHPSNADRLLTQKLMESGKLLGIPLLDHIIIGDGGQFFSFKKEGILFPESEDDDA